MESTLEKLGYEEAVAHFKNLGYYLPLSPSHNFIS